MGSRARTITRNRSSLTIPCSGTPTLTVTFTKSERTVRCTLPGTSNWALPLNWHLDPLKCQELQFMPGGKFYYFRCQGPYNSSSTGRTGDRHQLRPGELVVWQVFPHGRHRERDPDLEVVVTGDAGTEDMWRNAVSVELDKDLWPTLLSTPFIVRLALYLVKHVPLVGDWLWRTAVEWALRVQILMIYHQHSFYVWCGYVPITWFWNYNPCVGRTPEWASMAEKRSSELLAISVLRMSWYFGWAMLGMKHTYEEYYGSANLPSGTEDAHLERPAPSTQEVT